MENQFVLDGNEEILEYISKNKDKICCDKEVAYDIYKKIIPYEKTLEKIFMFDFVCGKSNSNVNTLENTFSLLISELSKFQGLVGGFEIDDEDWLICTENTRFKPLKNQKAIYNTVETFNVTNKLTWFLNMLIKRINQSIEIESNIKIHHKIYEDEKREISWIVIIVEKI